MPAPDPSGIYIEECEGGGLRLTCEIWWHGNRTNRVRRMMRIAENIRLSGWRCEHCGELIPLYRRVDAIYCRERCRKAAARNRLRREGWR